MFKCSSIKILSLALAGVAALGSSQAWAYDWGVEARVVAIESTYMPTQVLFSIDAAGSSCTVGTLLKWTPKGSTADEKIANAQAIFSTLLTAQASGRKVRVYGNNSGCTVDYLHILNQ
jgi:hypothetical protein